MTALQCVNLVMRRWNLQGTYQLWARPSPDEDPCPLIGHERPCAIKLSNLRHKLSTEEGFDLEHCTKSGHDTCHFILKSVNKTPIKNKKSKITGLLRRSFSMNQNIFGTNLSRLDDNGLPKPILIILQKLFVEGPKTKGIFRVSPNKRIVRELRDQIDQTNDVDCLEDVPIITIAGLLQEFLRSLPDPLLTFHLYSLWMSSLNCDNKIQKIKNILNQLPKANYTLLSHIICVLHHISRNEKTSCMNPSSLGVCFGPCLLWSSSITIDQNREVHISNVIIELIIRHCEVLFGDGVTLLFGEEKSDSGAEESTDSLHSGGISLDSLDLTEPPRKDHMSLSRDSGLTLSDCQLFIPESPVGSEDSTVNTSTSSFEKSLSDKEKTITKSYVPVYNGWEERLNRYTTTTTTTTNVHQTSTELLLNDERKLNPNFERKNWLRTHLKRTSRTKLDEHDNNIRDYHNQQNGIKENIDDYERNQQQDVNCAERISINDSEQGSTSESTLSNDNYDFNNKKQHFIDYKKKLKSDAYKIDTTSKKIIESYHSGSDIYEYKKNNDSDMYVTIGINEFITKRQLLNNIIYGNHDTVNDINGKNEHADLFSYKKTDKIDSYCDDVDNGGGGRIWVDAPPPLPPRLRHLPPVHMNLEDRHKIAIRSRSLPPPPPYRPPPQPNRAPITTRHLGYSRSVVDDESYV